MGAGFRKVKQRGEGFALLDMFPSHLLPEWLLTGSSPRPGAAVRPLPTPTSNRHHAMQQVSITRPFDS